MMGCRDSCRHLIYAQSGFTIWMVLGLACLTLGVGLDVPTIVLPGWGQSETQDYRTTVSLWTICNGTKFQGTIQDNICNATLLNDHGNLLYTYIFFTNGKFTFFCNFAIYGWLYFQFDMNNRCVQL